MNPEFNDIISSDKLLKFNDFLLYKKKMEIYDSSKVTHLEKRTTLGILTNSEMNRNDRVNKSVNGHKDILLHYNDVMKEVFSRRMYTFNYMKADLTMKSHLFYNEFLQFWQEFYYLFYLSLKIVVACYKSNSRIISLGESPSKLIFTQSLFYEDMVINNKLSENNFPTNLSFEYFPLSNLNGFLKDLSEPLHSHTIDHIYDTLATNITSDKIQFIMSYFSKFKLDPLSIVENNVIFLDRAETFTTVITFLFIYSKMIAFQQLNEDQIIKFKHNFKFIGYDEGDYNGTNRPEKSKLLKITKSFIEKYLVLSKKESNDMIKYIELKIIFNDTTSKALVIKLKKRIRYEPKSFYFNYLIPYKIISYSVPEIYNSKTRCIAKFNIIKNNNIILSPSPVNFKIKEIDNCNLLNYIIFDSYLKIRDKGDILKLLINFDNVNETKLYELDHSTFSEEIIELTDIVSNIIYNKSIAERIDSKDIRRYVDSRFKIDLPNSIMTLNNFNLDIYINPVENYRNKYMKYKIKYLKLIR